LISGLDAKIPEATTDKEEIETEVLQTEETNSIAKAKNHSTSYVHNNYSFRNTYIT